MSLKKTVAIAAAVGAMAAISVPAMALENEFHGTYTFNSIFSNFQDGGSGDFNPASRAKAATPGVFVINQTTGLIEATTAAKAATTTYGEHRKMNNYFEQRARIQYTAKVSDDLKLVTHFELDTRFGGITDNKYAGSSDGGVIDSDGISLETKHVYLDFNLGDNFNAKLGILPYKDTLKGIFVDADLPAIVTTTKMGAYTLGLGFSRFSESQQSASGSGNARLGDLAKDLVMIDNTFTISKDTKAALSYYLLADYQTADQAKLVNVLGLSGETKLGALSLSGFAALQAGHQKGQRPTAGAVGSTSKNYHGFAGNVAAKLAVGPGTARTAFLFVSGNNNSSSDGANDRGWQNTGVTSYNESGLMILSRNTANSPTSTDRYLRRVITNVAVATVGYDANLTDKVYANGNVGFAWAPASTSTINSGETTANLNNPHNNSGNYLGTELNLETGYKVNSNLTLRAQAAYAVLGAYYNKSTLNGAGVAADPENPYTMRLLASFKF